MEKDPVKVIQFHALLSPFYFCWAFTVSTSTNCFLVCCWHSINISSVSWSKSSQILSYGAQRERYSSLLSLKFQHGRLPFQTNYSSQQAALNVVFPSFLRVPGVLNKSESCNITLRFVPLLNICSVHLLPFQYCYRKSLIFLFSHYFASLDWLSCTVSCIFHICLLLLLLLESSAVL